jgi:F0F1-type ATP synthase membrane subunit b/b'
MLAVDATLLIVFFIVWILLIALKKVFFNPMRTILDKREKTIQSNIKAGHEAAAQYEINIKKIEESLKAARISAKEAQEQFAAEALREKERMMTEIAQECRARVEEAKSALEKQTKDLKKDLAAESKALSEKIEQRLLH